MRYTTYKEMLRNYQIENDYVNAPNLSEDVRRLAAYRAVHCLLCMVIGNHFDTPLVLYPDALDTYNMYKLAPKKFKETYAYKQIKYTKFFQYEEEDFDKFMSVYHSIIESMLEYLSNKEYVSLNVDASAQYYRIAAVLHEAYMLGDNIARGCGEGLLKALMGAYVARYCIVTGKNDPEFKSYEDVVKELSEVDTEHRYELGMSIARSYDTAQSEVELDFLYEALCSMFDEITSALKCIVKY